MGYRSRLPIEMRKTLQLIENQQQYTAQQSQETDNLRQLVESLNDRNLQMQDTINQLSGAINQIRSDEYFDACNLKGTARPIVWGDSSRLHISPKAAVFTCLFNVNSGEITVGDYTYAGSRVSVLAGSHDAMLTGFLRRDAEYTDGCDIHIGNGVWLGSNCTILGPATIEDNAVIAAGAVVTPGTIVEKNSVYGGVPARLIKRLKFPDDTEDINDEHIQKALQRNDGVLCVRGWHEKEHLSIDGKIFTVHRMVESSAIIYIKTETIELYVENNGTEQNKINLSLRPEPGYNQDFGEKGLEQVKEYSVVPGKQCIEINVEAESDLKIVCIQADVSCQNIYVKHKD